MSEDNVEQTIGVLDKILQVAEWMKITSAQLALAWLLAQGDDIFPIPGTSKIHRLEENLGALSVSLSDDDERKLREVSEEIVGGRFQARIGYDFADTPDLDHWICCMSPVSIESISINIAVLRDGPSIKPAWVRLIAVMIIINVSQGGQ